MERTRVVYGSEKGGERLDGDGLNDATLLQLVRGTLARPQDSSIARGARTFVVLSGN